MPTTPRLNQVAGDGELYYLADFLPAEQADDFFKRLLGTLAWQEEEIIIAGRRVKVPRLVCWYGDAGAVYRYSGTTHHPLPWTEALLDLKARIENHSGHDFNSVLGNLYRDGQDSMGWHADREKVLGVNPFIASLNLGEERLFRLRHNRSGETLDIALANGSLLLMGGALQHHWRHCVPKTKTEKSARINLTFRTIHG
ncbi:MAG: alpha-ketoglutarate-dependent dioxygenase AlkB [Methylococcaceae bacterium]|nr:alpha-ketoglutarate-dependent dioxygenase AlkB [Methylococcaceae bacterium]